MKRGRILSLFLSIVLIVSAIVPCIQLSVNADAANAISEIKAAWNQLQDENGTPAAVPPELEDTEDLVEAISIAEDAIADSAYTAESKTSLKTAVNSAWGVVKSNEKLVIKALQKYWTKLFKSDALYKSLASYNKTGINENKLQLWCDVAEGNDLLMRDDSTDMYLNDKAHSGGISSVASVSEEDISNFGKRYYKLGYEDPDVEGTEAKGFVDDIPSFKVGDALITELGQTAYYNNCMAFGVKVLSTKDVKIGCKIWFAPSTGGYVDTQPKYTNVKAGELTTIDVKKILESDSVGKIDGVMFYISEIPGGSVGVDDYIKFGDLLITSEEALPDDVQGEVSLATIFNKASNLDLTEYTDNTAKTRFQELILAARKLIREQFHDRFNDKSELITAVTKEIWPELLKKETSDIVSFEHYNSSGLQAEHSEVYTPDGSSGVGNATAGISDAANSGDTVLIPSKDEDKNTLGSHYVELTTAKFENGDTKLNTDKTNDIPYLSRQSSVLVADARGYISGDAKELTISVDASMPMVLTYRIWYGIYDKPNKANRTDNVIWAATGMNEVEVSTGSNTVDLIPTLNKCKENLLTEPPTSALYQTEIREVFFVTIGIKSMSEDPDASDYLKVGKIRGKFAEVLPSDLAKDSNITAIELYSAMQKLDLDVYVDGDTKEDFILAMESAKVFADQELEEIYSDRDRLADALKNVFWPGMTCKTAFTKEFRYYNRTGKDLEINYSGSLDPATSGTVFGKESSKEQKEIYGERYHRLTNSDINPDISQASERDIPYLSDESVLLTLGQSESNFINVADSTAIQLNLNSSMKMTIMLRIWYYTIQDGNGNGRLDDWWFADITFDIDEGLNQIDIKQILVDKKNSILQCMLSIL